MFFDTSGIIGFFKKLIKRTPEQIVSAGTGIAEIMKQDAKVNAPWTDRTGMARATIDRINQFAEGDADVYCIGIYGQQSYSPRLERGFGYRYAILLPTLRKYEADILENMTDIISRQEGLN